MPETVGQSSETCALSERRWHAAAALVIGAAGCIVASEVSWWAVNEYDSPAIASIVNVAILATTGLVVAILLGWQNTIRGLLGAPSTSALILGAGVGLLSSALAIGYDETLILLDALEPLQVRWSWLQFVHITVVAALLEETLFRGVIWESAKRIAPAWATVLITAALFAVTHGFHGGGDVWLPKHFVIGILWGWVRWRTGSLVPGMVAHSLSNAVLFFFFM